MKSSGTVEYLSCQEIEVHKLTEARFSPCLIIFLIQLVFWHPLATIARSELCPLRKQVFPFRLFHT